MLNEVDELARHSERTNDRRPVKYEILSLMFTK